MKKGYICYTMLCHATLCPAMLCYAILDTMQYNKEKEEAA